MQPSGADEEVAGSLRQGLIVQARSIHALIIRDIMQRYGRDNIGFAWVILHPMILTAGVTVLWTAIRSPYEHGVSIVALVITGYLPLTLWRHLTSAGVFVFRQSIGLLYHRPVKMMDAFLAKQIVEFIGTTTAALIVYFTLLAIGMLEPIKEPGLVLSGWLLLAWQSFGLGALFAAMTEYAEVTEHFIAPFQYLMMPLSGTFFMVYWLPTFAQDLILFNPMVHCYELIRAGFLGDQVIAYYDPWYVVVWNLGLMAVGFWGIDAVRDRVHF